MSRTGGQQGKTARDRRTVQHPPHLQAGKKAFRDLVSAFGGSVAAGAEVEKSQSRISAYGLPNTADFPPIDVVVALEQCTHGTAGHPHVLRWHARQLGYVLLKLPVCRKAAASWHRAMAAVSREVSDIIERVCTALSDEKVTAAEARRIREEIAEAHERLAELDALCIQIIDGEEEG